MGCPVTFLEFAHANGVLVEASKAYPSDKIRRCGTSSKPRSDNGAYFWDGRRGWVQDWANGGIVQWFRPEQTWTPEENKAYIDRKASLRADKDKDYARAALRATEALRAARIDGHPYLTAKGFPKEVGMVLEDRLLIPMRSVTDDLQGLQMIYEEGGKFVKKMLPGMKAKGAIFQMGSSRSEAWLVEGYATGLSVRAALNQIRAPASVIVCFSAGNLVHIAQKTPLDKKVFIFADNDESSTGEKAAIETGRPWTMADEIGFDANDLHQKKGLFSLAKKIVELRNDYLA